MPDCRHTIDLCPDCDGLRTTTMTRLPGVTSIRLDSDDPSIRYQGAAAVYIGPAPGPCPNPVRNLDRG